MLSSKRAPCSVFDSLVLLRINVGKDEAKILVSLCYVFSGGCFFFFPSVFWWRCGFLVCLVLVFVSYCGVFAYNSELLCAYFFCFKNLMPQYFVSTPLIKTNWTKSQKWWKSGEYVL